MRPFHFATATAFAVMMAAAVPAHALPTLTGDDPIVIAHRGASGYLPEHTLAAYELAIKMGAAFIEPDLQLTKDGHLVAMHDTTLTRTTNVETALGMRNGGYRVSDYTLAEIKTLTVEPVGTSQNTYPGFTPTSADPLRVPTFQEVIDLAKAKSVEAGRVVGLYPEAKQSDPLMENLIISTLKASGYGAATDKVFIQSFSNATIQSIATKQAAEGMNLDLVVLGAAGSKIVDGKTVYVLRTSSGDIEFDDLAEYADGIGVSLSAAITEAFIAAAHEAGLEVHGWTFNKANPDTVIPEFWRYYALGMDGVFANYPDLALRALASVPGPSALGLLGLGLVGLGASAYRRRAA
jgi:glycerophosphoryl diester phosphodiesterase